MMNFRHVDHSAACLALVFGASALSIRGRHRLRAIAPIISLTPSLPPLQRAGAAGHARAPTVVAGKLAPENMTAQQIVDPQHRCTRRGLAALAAAPSMTLAELSRCRQEPENTRQVAIVSTGAREARCQLRKACSGAAVGQPQHVIPLPFQMDFQAPLMTRLEVPSQGQRLCRLRRRERAGSCGILGRHESSAFTANS